MDVTYKSINVILHGSPFQNLVKINSSNARYKEKVFGTYNYQRALRYIASLKNGGDSVLSKNGKLFILNSNPASLVEEKGSIYLVQNNTFTPDSHKGEKYDWIYSSTKELDVIAEIQYNNVLEVWNLHKIIAVSKEMSEKILNKADEAILNECISINSDLLSIR